MPCVSTNLNEIKNFNKKNNNIVDICKNDEEFLNSIDRNLNMQPMLKKKLVEKRINISKKYDWKILFERFEKICTVNLINKNFQKEKSWAQGIDLAKSHIKK